MSQEVLKRAVPTGSNWNEHSFGSAYTVTGALATARARSGFAAAVSALNKGKYVRAANRHAPKMMGLRPTLSDNQPKKTYNGVEIISAVATSKLVSAASTLSTRSMKNST